MPPGRYRREEYVGSRSSVALEKQCLGEVHFIRGRSLLKTVLILGRLSASLGRSVAPFSASRVYDPQDVITLSILVQRVRYRLVRERIVD